MNIGSNRHGRCLSAGPALGLAAALAACGVEKTAGGGGTATGGTATGGGPDSGSAGGGFAEVEVFDARDVDILFVIDNSGSMGEEQGTLAANFSDFVSVLEHPIVAANYRIGITTTDNGNPQCNGTSPEGGKLRLSSCRSRESEFTFSGTNPPTVRYDEACTAVCPDTLANLETIPTTTADDPIPKPRAWIENIQGRTNLPDGVTTAQALACFGPQGINGCGFESPLESMWKSLVLTEQSDTPNFDFRRPAAALAVVIVTDEVDCSLDPTYGTIFDPNGNRVFWSDPNSNFPTSAVCWNAGVSCQGARAPIRAATRSTRTWTATRTCPTTRPCCFRCRSTWTSCRASRRSSRGSCPAGR